MFVAAQAEKRAIRPDNDSRVSVEEVARRRIADCPYAFYFKDVEFRFDESVLVVQGRVPSFYMKQVIQTLLKGIEGVEAIDNRVAVVNAAGLSSR